METLWNDFKTVRKWVLLKFLLCHLQFSHLEYIYVKGELTVKRTVFEYIYIWDLKRLWKSYTHKWYQFVFFKGLWPILFFYGKFARAAASKWSVCTKAHINLLDIMLQSRYTSVARSETGLWYFFSIPDILILKPSFHASTGDEHRTRPQQSYS